MPKSLKLFVNYRRADHADFVEHMRTWFMHRYGRENVFMDFDTIPPFARFEDFIREKVRECDALVAVIGPHWAELIREREASGKPDYVRVELEEALRHGKVIAPICIKDAHVPPEEEIPDNLQPIFERNVPSLRSGKDILDDIFGIMDALETELAAQGKRRQTHQPEEVRDPTEAISVYEMLNSYYEALHGNDLTSALIQLSRMRESGAVIPSFINLDEQEAMLQARIKEEEEARRRREVADYLYGFVRVMARFDQDVCEAMREVWRVLPDYDPDDLGQGCLEVSEPEPEPMPHPRETRKPYEPEMVLIPAGPFLMGSPKSDKLRFNDEPEQFELTLDYDYAIGRYPVTAGQYRAFMDAGGYREDRWWTNAGWKQRESEGWTLPRYWGESPWTDSDDLPVVGVSWYEAYAYTCWLAEATGRGYRLPTEAEWEKAARGGLQIPDGRGGLKKNPNPARIWPWGDEPPTKELCNFDNNLGQTSPVTSHAAQAERQPYGLYHMAGNVWAWCLSEWAKPYVHPEVNDPDGGGTRLLRGGSWDSDPQLCRVSCRSPGSPNSWNIYLGFRCALSYSSGF